MNFSTMMQNFLLSEWLWSITWGVYHIPVTIAIMTLFFKFLARMKLKRAFIFSALAQTSAGLLFTSFVAGYLIYSLKLNYAPEPSEMPNQLLICLYLGLIYAILESIFFIIASFFYALPLRRVLWITFLSNAIGAWLVNLFVPRL